MNKRDLATAEAIIKEANSWGFIFTHNKEDEVREMIYAALTTARKDAREAACAKVEAAVWLATKDFKGILNEVQRRAIALATATYVEAAANVEEGAGNERNL